MFCPNCGGESPDGSKFCGLCGQTFETPAFEEAPAVAEELPEQMIAEVTEPAEEQSEPMISEENASIAEETAPPIEETAPAVELSKPEPVIQQPEQPTYQQPEQPVYQQPQQPMYQQPEQPVYQQPQQPVYQQPQQPTYQQPQQPYGAQPAYGQPYAQPRMRVPLDPKKKQAIIIGSVCGVVLVTFLILLFTVIIPSGGIKGKLRHVWVRDGSSTSLTIDLKNNKVMSGSETMNITKWTVEGNILQVDYVGNVWGSEVSLTERYIIAMTTDGKVLMLFDPEDYEPDYVDYVMKRAD